MKKLQINDLCMNGGSSMIGPHWTDDAGNRFHLWLETEGDYNEGFRPVTPYRVKGDSPLYMNPPRNADGSFKNTREPGHFKTRYLTVDAAKNAPLVAEVLRRCEAEGLFEKAKADEERKEREREANIRAERVAAIREGLDRIANSSVTASAIAHDLRQESDEVLLLLDRAF